MTTTARDLSRRQFLKTVGLATAAPAPAGLRLPAPFSEG